MKEKLFVVWLLMQLLNNLQWSNVNSFFFFFLMHALIIRYQGYIGAALVLGGVDVTGPHLYSIYPHGSTDKLPYVTMGECNVSWCFRILLFTKVVSKRAGLFPDRRGSTMCFDSFCKHLLISSWALGLFHVLEIQQWTKFRLNVLSTRSLYFSGSGQTVTTALC